MAKATTTTVPEWVLLFCVASGTDWVKAGVTHATAQPLARQESGGARSRDTVALTDQGRVVLNRC
jgi:hypothetical protein